MNDAPAPFPVAPSNAGGCGLDIVDAYAQHAVASIHVRGALTASPATLAWPAPTDHGERVVLLQKADDNEALRPNVLSDTCAGIARTRWVSQSAPSAWSDTASVQFGVDPVVAANGYNAGGACTIAIASQYAGEPPVTIAIDIAKPPQPMQSWPEQITMGANGATLAYAQPRNIDLAEILNFAIGGRIADAATTSGCYAYALTYPGGVPEPAPPQANALGIYTDGNGCYTNAGGTPIANPQIALWEPGGAAKTFITQRFTCTSSSVIHGTWNPASAYGARVGLPLIPGSTPTGSGGCNIGITDGVTAPVVDHGLTHVVVQQSCPNTGNALLASDGYCYDLYHWENDCQSTDIFGFITHWCEPPFVSDTGQWVAHFAYVPHGTTLGFQYDLSTCAESFVGSYTGIYAQWYFYAGLPNPINVPGPYNITQSNSVGLAVPNESAAAAVPIIGATPSPAQKKLCKGGPGGPPLP